MARQFTTWGGVRISRTKTVGQLVDQLNRQNRAQSTSESFSRRLSANMAIGNSTALRRYGIDYDRATGMFSLTDKGSRNQLTPLAAVAGTNG